MWLDAERCSNAPKIHQAEKVVRVNAATLPELINVFVMIPGTCTTQWERNAMCFTFVNSTLKMLACHAESNYYCVCGMRPRGIATLRRKTRNTAKKGCSGKRCNVA